MRLTLAELLFLTGFAQSCLFTLSTLRASLRNNFAFLSSGLFSASSAIIARGNSQKTRLLPVLLFRLRTR
jgi:hypothetical protein